MTKPSLSSKLKGSVNRASVKLSSVKRLSINLGKIG